jgi:hypothetical protein|tara:strand:+ start:1955 stop:2215 length:261 start_codon:yes stop_codon:yes gene_type:complete
MIYQLPSGRILEISTEQYLDLSDQDIQDLVGLSNYFTSDVGNPFYKSFASRGKKEPIVDNHEVEPTLEDIKDIEKLNDRYFHRDDT